ncbi:MAG: FG-GAP-like repeat-containing protein [Gammaproteobacteria bacterium]
MTAIAGSSRNDLWAVGYDFVTTTYTSTYSAQIAHYDGDAWTVTQAPPLGSSTVGSGLIGVAVDSADDAWAVGYQTSGTGDHALIEHYDGSGWTAVSDLPNPGSASNVLVGVSATAPDNVWAVGYQSSGTGYFPLVLHYNGQNWNVVQNAEGSGWQTGLRSVADVLASGRVVTAGFDFDPQFGAYFPFSETWPESDPTQITLLPPAASGGVPLGIEFHNLAVAPSNNQIWTTGEPSLAETICLNGAAPSVERPAPPFEAAVTQGRSAAPAESLRTTAAVQARRWALARERYNAAGGLVVASDIASEAFIGGIPLTITFGAAVGDFAGPSGPGPDGYQDFELGRHGSAPLQLWVSQGDGTFLQVDAGDFPEADRHLCTWGDLGSPTSPVTDGLPDLYCAIGGQKGLGIKTNELWIQQPDGSFAPPPYNPVNYPDMAVMDPFGRSHASAAFYAGNTTAKGPHPLSLFVGEGIPQRGDGLPDPNRFFLNENGVLVSSPASGLDHQLGGWCAQPDDYNNDHYTDLLVCTKDPIGLALYRNDGPVGPGGIPEFTNVTAAAGINPKKTQFGLLTDLNADGCADLVMVFTTSLQVDLQNTSKGTCLGTFSTTWSRPLDMGAWAAAGDVNGDGIPDLYILQGGTDPDIMLINNGDGTSFSSVPMPEADAGAGDKVSAIKNALTGLTDFIVLNGAGALGPVQLIHFSPNPTPNPLTITSAPPAQTSATTAEFAFQSTETGVDFDCSLDGTDPVQCTSPETYTGLAGGQHAFSVWSIEANGNVSAEATWSWAVTGAPPPPPPNLVATIKQPKGNVNIHVGDSVNFGGACDSGGEKITGYSWDFGNGITSNILNPGKVPYAAAGAFTTKFTCSDADGRSAPATLVVTVTNGGGSGGGGGSTDLLGLALLFLLIAVRNYRSAGRRTKPRQSG